MLDLGLRRHESHQYLCLKHLRNVCTKFAKNAYTLNKGHGAPSPLPVLPSQTPFQEHYEKNRLFGEIWVCLDFVKIFLVR